ncbi:Phospholipase, patatin family protein, variant 2 [Balamuthia mandrillaris]
MDGSASPSSFVGGGEASPDVEYEDWAVLASGNHFVSSGPPLVKEGWLTKQGASWKTWRERYFKMYGDGFIYYYPNDSLGARSLGELCLVQASIRFENSLFRRGQHGWVISVTKPKPRDYILFSKTAEERASWIESINTIIHRLPKEQLQRRMFFTDEEEEEDEEEAFDEDGDDEEDKEEGENGEEGEAKNKKGRARFKDFDFGSWLHSSDNVKNDKAAEAKEREKEEEEDYSVPWHWMDHCVGLRANNKNVAVLCCVSGYTISSCELHFKGRDELLLNSASPSPSATSLTTPSTSFSDNSLSYSLPPTSSSSTPSSSASPPSSSSSLSYSLSSASSVTVSAIATTSGSSTTIASSTTTSTTTTTVIATSPQVIVKSETSQLLFAGKEAWVFVIPLKGSNKTLELAADTRLQMEAWCHFFTAASSSRRTSVSSEESLASSLATMNSGFLWVKKTSGLWDRFFCISDYSQLERFKIKDVRGVKLKDILHSETISLDQSSSSKKVIPLMNKSQSKSKILSQVCHGNKVLKLYFSNKSSSSSSSSSSSASFATASVAASRAISFVVRDQDHLLYLRELIMSAVDDLQPPTTKAKESNRQDLKSSMQASLLKISSRFRYGNKEGQQEKTNATSPSCSLSSSKEKVVISSPEVRQRRRQQQQQKRLMQERKRRRRKRTRMTNVLLLECDLQSARFEALHSEHTELRNLARNLRQRGAQEANATSFGDWDTSKKVNDGHFRILSLDGGGLRAIMEAVLLTRLVRIFPDLMERIDLFAGVSGGSIVASALATGHSPEYVVEMFYLFGPFGFKRKASTAGQWFSIRQAKFGNEALAAGGDEFYHNLTLKQVPRNILITSFCLDNDGFGGKLRSWEPRIYHNIPLKKFHSSTSFPSTRKHIPLDQMDPSTMNPGDLLLWDCVMASAAAPIFFPSFKKHVDGACMVNNPALTALTTVISEEVVEKKDLDKVHILSLGTGKLSQFLDGSEHDWGMLQWGPKLAEVIFGAGLLHQERMVEMLLGDRYHQLNPFMEKPLAMDDPALLPVLVEIADNVDLRKTIEWIRVNFYGEEPRRRRRDSLKEKKEQQPSGRKENGEVGEESEDSESSDSDSEGEKENDKMRGGRLGGMEEHHRLVHDRTAWYESSSFLVLRWHLIREQGSLPLSKPQDKRTNDSTMAGRSVTILLGLCVCFFLCGSSAAILDLILDPLCGEGCVDDVFSSLEDVFEYASGEVVEQLTLTITEGVFDLPLLPDYPLTIIGDLEDLSKVILTIPSGSCGSLAANLTLQGLTLQSACSTTALVVEAGLTLTLDNVAIVEAVATAVQVNNGALLLTNNLLSDILEPTVVLSDGAQWISSGTVEILNTATSGDAHAAPAIQLGSNAFWQSNGPVSFTGLLIPALRLNISATWKQHAAVTFQDNVITDASRSLVHLSGSTWLSLAPVELIDNSVSGTIYLLILHLVPCFYHLLISSFLCSLSYVSFSLKQPSLL